MVKTKTKQNKTNKTKTKGQKLEVLIEKGSAAVSCNANVGQRQCVEQLNI